MPGMGSLTPAATQLGLVAGGQGDALKQQQVDQTEEERRKKRLGLSSLTPATAALFGPQAAFAY
jgi:hypothetical protein